MFVENYIGPFQELASDLLMVPVFEDEQPPKDLCGVVDWQLAQQVSHWMLDGNIIGNVGEMILFPLADYRPARKILFYGLGPLKQYSKTVLFAAIPNLLHKIEQLGSLDVAIRFRKPEGIDGKTWQSLTWHEINKGNLKKDVLIRLIDAQVVSSEIPVSSSYQQQLRQELKDDLSSS